LIEPSNNGALGQTSVSGQPSPAPPSPASAGSGGTVASLLAEAVSRTLEGKADQNDLDAWKAALLTLKKALEQALPPGAAPPQGPSPQGVGPAQGGNIIPPQTSPGFPGQVG